MYAPDFIMEIHLKCSLTPSLMCLSICATVREKANITTMAVSSQNHTLLTFQSENLSKFINETFAYKSEKKSENPTEPDCAVVFAISVSKSKAPVSR